MTPEDYSSRISALIRLSHFRPRLFPLRIIAGAVSPLVGAVSLLPILYAGRVLAAFLLALAAGGIISLLLPDPTFITALFIAFALLLPALLLYGLTRLRRVNDRVLRRLRTYPVPPNGILLDDAQSQREEVGVDERLRLAWLTEELQGEEEALDEYRQVLALDPGNTPATFALGRLMLWSGELEGVALIDTAIDQEENSYLIPGVEIACSLLARQNRSEQAREFYERHRERYQKLTMLRSEKNALALEERSKFRFTDLYMEHRMSKRDLERLREVLARFPQIEQAYLVRKQVEHYDEIPCYLLGLLCSFDSDSRIGRQERGYLVQQLYDYLGFLGKFTIILLEDQPDEKMWRVMESVEGSVVYVRE